MPPFICLRFGTVYCTYSGLRSISCPRWPTAVVFLLPATERHTHAHTTPAGKMFSGFDNFAEGFKRFSLDALQDQEEQEDGTTLEQRIMPVVPAEQPNVSVETPPQKLPSLKEEHNEWDWDQENTSTAVDRQGVSKVGASQQRHETHLERPPKPASTASVGLIDGGVAVPSLAAASHAELEQIALHENHWRTGGALGEPGGPEREVANNKAEERRERKGLAANNDPLSVQVNTVREWLVCTNLHVVLALYHKLTAVQSML